LLNFQNEAPGNLAKIMTILKIFNDYKILGGIGIEYSKLPHLSTTIEYTYHSHYFARFLSASFCKLNNFTLLEASYNCLHVGNEVIVFLQITLHKQIHNDKHKKIKKNSLKFRYLYIGNAIMYADKCSLFFII